jgi:hypothetical protein
MAESSFSVEFFSSVFVQSSRHEAKITIVIERLEFWLTFNDTAV